MLTIFSTPKPFEGHIELVQRNAIRSWLCLFRDCEIILLGDEKGTEEVAKEFGLRHISEVAYNKFGTPLVNSIFEIVQSAATYDILCYVNTDIILMSDFVEALQRVIEKKQRFLMVGERWDVEVKEFLDFKAADREQKLRLHVSKHGQLHFPRAVAMDYFVFPRFIWGKLPPFAVGRPGWDNWMIYRARCLGIPVIDVTPMVMAIHQNHTYNHPGCAKLIKKILGWR